MSPVSFMELGRAVEPDEIVVRAVPFQGYGVR
jgi:hypothetical protein